VTSEADQFTSALACKRCRLLERSPLLWRLDDEPPAEPVPLAELDPPRSSRAPRPAPARSRLGSGSRRGPRCVCDSGVRTAGCCWSLSGLMSMVTETQCAQNEMLVDTRLGSLLAGLVPKVSMSCALTYRIEYAKASTIVFHTIIEVILR